MQGQITNPAAVDAAVEAWQNDASNAADLMMRLHPAARLIACRRLGYSTRAHLEMFGLELLADDMEPVPPSLIV